jgi:hypothetical protein
MRQVADLMIRDSKLSDTAAIKQVTGKPLDETLTRSRTGSSILPLHSLRISEDCGATSTAAAGALYFRYAHGHRDMILLTCANSNSN